VVFAAKPLSIACASHEDTKMVCQVALERSIFVSSCESIKAASPLALHLGAFPPLREIVLLPQISVRKYSAFVLFMVCSDIDSMQETKQC
jgi:hypothetical protein